MKYKTNWGGSLLKANKINMWKVKKRHIDMEEVLSIDNEILPGNAQFIGSRNDQQDSFGFSDIENIDLVEKVGVLAVLADGMGGLEKGKDASNVAVKEMLNSFAESPGDEPTVQILNRILHLTNSSILEFADKYDLYRGMGTTMIAAVIKEESLYWISVGDSRLYLFRNNILTQMTEDHNYAMELEKDVNFGKITREEALSENCRDYLTSYLGMEEIKYIDSNFEPFKLEKKDLILLCSDGLYKTLNNEEIIRILNENKNNPQEAAEKLISKVKNYEKIYQDNVTVVILGYKLL